MRRIHQLITMTSHDRDGNGCYCDRRQTNQLECVFCAILDFIFNNNCNDECCFRLSMLSVVYGCQRRVLFIILLMLSVV